MLGQVDSHGWRGLSTHPCGTPVFMVRVEDVHLPNLTVWGLLVKKSRLQIVAFRPRLWRLDTSQLGIIMLKVEQKSKMMYMSGLSR